MLLMSVVAHEQRNCCPPLEWEVTCGTDLTLLTRFPIGRTQVCPNRPLRDRGAEAHHPHPTLYALNTETAFRRQSAQLLKVSIKYAILMLHGLKLIPCPDKLPDVRRNLSTKTKPRAAPVFSQRTWT